MLSPTGELDCFPIFKKKNRKKLFNWGKKVLFGLAFKGHDITKLKILVLVAYL